MTLEPNAPRDEIMQLTELTNPLELRAIIYELVQKRDEAGLRSLEEMGITVDGRYGNSTVVRQFALAGDKASVEFLVEKFASSVDCAIVGYAAGKHTAAVNDLLSRGASIDYAVLGYAFGCHVKEVYGLLAKHACIDMAVEGYARGGQVDAVNDLLKQGASIHYAVAGYACERYVQEVNDLLRRGASRTKAAAGYARGGHVQEVNDLLARGACRHEAIFGYARSGHIQAVNDLLKIEIRLLGWAAIGYASGKHVREVNELLERGASRDQSIYSYAERGYIKEVEDLLAKGASLGNAVEGYASGGHVASVDALLARGANLINAVVGYASRGRTQEVNALLQRGVSRDWAVYGYARGGYVASVNALLASGASRDEAVSGYAFGYFMKFVNLLLKQGASHSRAIEGYVSGGHIHIEKALYLMSHTEDVQFRQLLRQELAKKSPGKDLSEVFQQAGIINKLMTDYVLNFKQASALVAMSEIQKVWILQGLRWVVKKQQLPAAVFLHITAHVLNLRLSDTRNVLTVIYSQFYTNCLDHLLTQQLPQQIKIMNGRYEFTQIWCNRFRQHAKVVADPYPTGEYGLFGGDLYESDLLASAKYNVPDAALTIRVPLPQQEPELVIVNPLPVQASLTNMLKKMLQLIIRPSPALNYDARIQTLIDLTQRRDSAGLQRLEDMGVLVNAYYGMHNVVEEFAYRGDTVSVTYLVHNFGAHLNTAVGGYARGGHIREVNELLARGVSVKWALVGYGQAGNIKLVNQLLAEGASRDDAVYGFALGGYTRQVNQQLQQGASRDDAVFGYAVRGDVAKVNALLRQGASPDLAVFGYTFAGRTEEVNELLQLNGRNRACTVYGYALGGHIEQVNAQLAAGASREDAVYGYYNGRHLYRKHALYIMSLADDVATRQSILDRFNGRYLEKMDAVFQKAGIINKMLVNASISFPQMLLLIEPTNVKGLLAIIYELTQKRDTEGLRNLEAMGVCVNATYGIQNVVEEFAYHGDTAAVDYLIETFNASLCDAVVGYARGGFVKQVAMLLQQGAGKDWAMHGYACGGYIRQVNALLDEGAELSWAVSGYARMGYVNAVNALLARGALLYDAVFGYAVGGYTQQVNELLALGANRRGAVWGYAVGGHIKQVNAQLVLGASRDDAVCGYAVGGYTLQVNAQLALGARRSLAVYGYATGRHVHQVNEHLALAEDCDYEALRGYAYGGHLDKVGEFTPADLLQQRKQKIVDSYDLGGYMYAENALYAMSISNHPQLRTILLNAFKNRYPKQDMDAVCRKAAKINAMMLDYSIHYRQALLLVSMPLPQKIWILQGLDLVRREKLTAVTFLHITARVLGLNVRLTNRVMLSQHQQFFRNSIHQLIADHVQKCNLTRENYFTSYNQIHARYDYATATFFGQNPTTQPVNYIPTL